MHVDQIGDIDTFLDRHVGVLFRILGTYGLQQPFIGGYVADVYKRQVP